MTEWSNVVDCKSIGFYLHGFKSHSSYSREYSSIGRIGLLQRQGLWVQVPLFPKVLIKEKYLKFIVKKVQKYLKFLQKKRKMY